MTMAKPGCCEPVFDLLAPENEYLDPTPDVHTLFLEYNSLFFDGKLSGCEVKWSPRMTLCAGVCSYQPRSGFCSIRLSAPLLKLRPRGDLINTLLHEMIHAYVFVSSPIKDHDDHGPVFQSHMNRINQLARTKITVYHTFHEEVDSYRQHWWQCDGPCKHAKPYFGLVKRAMNRPPGPTDRWWPEHQAKCGGTYAKINEPPGYKAKGEKKRKAAAQQITNYFSTESETGETKEGKQPSGKSKSTSTKPTTDPGAVVPLKAPKPVAKPPKPVNKLPPPGKKPKTETEVASIFGNAVVISTQDGELLLAGSMDVMQSNRGHTATESLANKGPRQIQQVLTSQDGVIDLVSPIKEEQSRRAQEEERHFEEQMQHAIAESAALARGQAKPEIEVIEID